MAILQSGGCDLHYEVHGVGEPILGLHGSPSAAVMWEDAAQRLSSRGSVIIYDRRGFLRSASKPPASTIDLADHVGDAARLLREVAAAPGVVIGRSTGGLVGLALTLARPELVSALVLLEPAVFGVTPQVRSWAADIRSAVLAETEQDASRASRCVFEHILGPGAWEDLTEEGRALFTSLSPGVLAEMRGHGLDLSADPFGPAEEELASITVPTLVVSGRDSFVMSRVVDDHLAAHLPRSRHVVVDGGHLIDPAHPVVLEFLADVRGAQESEGE